MKFTEDDKKLLTEFLEECWHYAKSVDNGMLKCDLCLCEYPTTNQQRTFTTWQDLGDLKDKLAEKRMWQSFHESAWRRSRMTWAYMMEDWLLDPAVFIPLVVEFLKKEKA